jgi:hypothetical protein
MSLDSPSKDENGMSDRISAQAPSTWWVTVLAALVFLLLFSRSMMRDLDLDEHQFVAPPLLLLHQGARPYVDYPYFHMPLLIYIYAGLFHFSAYPLLTARLFSVLCGTTIVMFLFRTGWRLLAPRCESRTCWILVGGLTGVFMTCRLFTYTDGWAWNHDAAVLCALLAFLCHVRGLRTGRIAPFVGAGFLLAIATGIRLSLAVTFVPCALSLAFGNIPITWRRRVLALVGAMVAASVAFLPVWQLLLKAPREFVFGNFEYASLNTQYYQALGGGGPMNLLGKVYHLLQTFLTDPGNAALLIFFLAALVAMVRRAGDVAGDGEILFLLGFVIALLIGSWGPTPTQYQYYFQLLPFLVLTVWSVVARRPESAGGWARAVGIAAVVAIGTGLPRWYWPIIRLTTPQRWTPVVAHHDAAWLRRQMPSGGKVLTTDVAIPLEAELAVYPEYAVGRHPIHVAPFLAPRQRRTQRIAWAEELDRLLVERPADAVFVDRRVELDSADLLAYARKRGYRMIPSPDGQYELWSPQETGVTASRENPSPHR